MFERKTLLYLKEWKTKKNRKPLILRGARQVGKTTIVKIFAKEEFDNFININLEKAEHKKIFQKVNSVEDFQKTVEIFFKQSIIPQKTLIFIDEIQNSPHLISLLRFFYEETPHWHIISAGSLLETMIEKQGLTMPVGRVEYLYIYPLTFFEYLKAVGEEKLLAFLENVSFSETIPPSLHEIAQNLFKQYSLLGGMPEVVSLSIKKESQENINVVYSSLLTGYQEDIYKYSSQAKLKYISYVLEQAPYFVGERIIYEKFGQSNYKSREMGKAFQTLEKAQLLKEVPNTISTKVPIVARFKAAKKLLFLDVGLVNYQNNIQGNFLEKSDLSDIYRGKIAEQVVGQNILARRLTESQRLFFWTKPKHQGSAEVDFCFSEGESIIGIEVKSGNSKRLKSLFSFAQSVSNSQLVRIYSGELKKERVEYAGKKYWLLSLPFYLVNRI